MRNMEHVIAGLGAEPFRGAFLGSINSIATVDHVALIRFDRDSRARILFSATRSGARIEGHGVQRAYENRYFHCDPNRSVCSERGVAGAPLMQRLQPMQITNSSYRYHCFDSAHLVDRLSIIAPSDEFNYCINLYRCSDTGQFSAGESDALRERAKLLAALAVKHAQLSCNSNSSTDRDARLTELTRRLALLQKGLSRREIEITARMMLGLGSEAISLELDLTRNSVATYRKRAYTKLGIGCQSELFSLCYFG